MVLLAVTVLSICPLRAIASNGVLEINQTCAVQTGCFQNDFFGFPVEISAATGEGRSFRLTSDLVVPAGITGIIIYKDSVSLDLNGFRIVRAGCELATAPCNTAQGAGNGVLIQGAPDVSIHNGSIVGMAAAGIFAQSTTSRGCHISDMVIKWAGSFAIYSDAECTILNSRISENGTTNQSGIRSGGKSVIVGNSVDTSAGHGIEVTDGGSVIKWNRVQSSGIDGIYAIGGDSVIHGNVSNANTDSGIRAFGSGSTISGNAACDNTVHGISVSDGTAIFDNIANSNGSIGIRAFSGTSVYRNVAGSNLSFGLSLASSVTYRGNTVTRATGAGTVNGGLDMGANSCDSATSCP